MKIISNPTVLTIDNFQIAEGQIHLSGWLADPMQRLTHYSVFINSILWVENEPLSIRDDVRQNRWPDIPHTAQSGIGVVRPIGNVKPVGDSYTATVVAKRDGVECARVALLLNDISRDSERLPVPESELQHHVGQMTGNFLQTGWRIYGDIKLNVERYRSFKALTHVLDWGCGCSRVLRYLLADIPATNVYGCDIDADAIRWDNENIKGPSFATIDPLPPTPYADRFFDLIYGISIFTHLDEPTQFKWLKELRRIAKPGGLVAVSVLNLSVAPPNLRAIAKEKGFADEVSVQADIFKQFAGADYYRLTCHTPEYIQRHWSKYFDLVEYISAGINAHQDLVLMTVP